MNKAARRLQRRRRIKRILLATEPLQLPLRVVEQHEAASLQWFGGKPYSLSANSTRRWLRTG
jgi:hypothetical protein